MAPTAMSLIDLKGHICCLQPFELPYLGNCSTY